MTSNYMRQSSTLFCILFFYRQRDSRPASTTPSCEINVFDRITMNAPLQIACAWSSQMTNNSVSLELDHIKHNNDVLTHNIYWMECMLSYCLLSQCLVNIFVHPTRDMMMVTWNALEPASSTRDCESMNFYFFFFFSIDIWIMMYIDEFGEIIQNATRIFSR